MTIQKRQHFEIIKELAKIRAPSGMESARAEHFITLAKKYAPHAEIRKDHFGNVIICYKNKSESVVESSDTADSRKILKIGIIGHLDEIGATVSKINKDGKIQIQKRGGYENRSLISQRVKIYTLNDEWINGIILGRTTHSIPSSKRNKIPNVNKLEIFLGCKNSQEVKDFGVHVGAPVVFEGYTEYLNPSISEDIVLSNSLDNIGSLSIILEICSRLEEGNCHENLSCEVYFVAAVREEIGREGALHWAQTEKPDLTIAIDFAVVESDKDAIDCGGGFFDGPFIVWTEAQGREVFDYTINRQFLETAKKHNLPFQHGVFEFYGSDSGLIQKQLGIPSTLIGFPLLAGHNVPEVISLSEIGKSADLIMAWLRDNYSEEV